MTNNKERGAAGASAVEFISLSSVGWVVSAGSLHLKGHNGSADDVGQGCCCLWHHHAALATMVALRYGIPLKACSCCVVANMPCAVLYLPCRRILHWDRNYHPGKDQQHKRVQMSDSAADLGLLNPGAGVHKRTNGAAPAPAGSQA